MLFEARRKHGTKLSHTEAYKLFHEKLALCVKPTFFNLRKTHKQILESIHFVDEKLKTVKKEILEALHALLAEFHNKIEAKSAPMNDQLLKEEEKIIAKEHNLNLPSKFKSSDECLLFVKCWQGIVQMDMHSEAGDACLAGIELCRRFLPGIFKKFDLEDIYNAGETRLFYRQLPIRALMKK